jgi:putative transcriptional regulator
MKEKNLRQQDLAEEVGLLQSTISQLANTRKNSINKGHLEKIINTYGITDITKLIKIVEK